jgi:hypothetical protein
MEIIAGLLSRAVLEGDWTRRTVWTQTILTERRRNGDRTETWRMVWIDPNTCGSSVWNFPHITLPAPAIWSGSRIYGKFVYPCLHVYVGKAVWLPVAVSLKTCISEVPGSNLGRPSAILTGLSWFLSASFGQMSAYCIDYAETAYRRERVRAPLKILFGVSVSVWSWSLDNEKALAHWRGGGSILHSVYVSQYIFGVTW